MKIYVWPNNDNAFHATHYKRMRNEKWMRNQWHKKNVVLKCKYVLFYMKVCQRFRLEAYDSTKGETGVKL